MTALLAVRDLHVRFRDEEHDVEVLNGVSFDVAPGSTVGLVGESGCGKSVTALSVMRLLPQPAGRITHGSILFEGQDLATVPAANMARIRGNRIAMIFQEPMTALNPVHRVGRQVEELLQLHRPELGAADRRRAALAMFERVGIPAAAQRLDEYPHQLSGGMRQRVMIAMALALQPALLIADEPTTALDVTIQAQILDLIADLQRQHGMAVLLITHDLGVVAEVCSDVVVMYAGRIAERAGADALFAAPRHPYTRGLLASIPRLDGEPKTPLPVIHGMVPALTALPPGCRFGNRCPHVQQACTLAPPEPEAVNANEDGSGTHLHEVACLRWRALPA
jgi:peptide/nickel transport system ATP-binding protein